MRNVHLNIQSLGEDCNFTCEATIVVDRIVVGEDAKWTVVQTAAIKDALEEAVRSSVSVMHQGVSSFAVSVHLEDLVVE